MLSALAEDTGPSFSTEDPERICALLKAQPEWKAVTQPIDYKSSDHGAAAHQAWYRGLSRLTKKAVRALFPQGTVSVRGNFPNDGNYWIHVHVTLPGFDERFSGQVMRQVEALLEATGLPYDTYQPDLREPATCLLISICSS